MELFVTLPSYIDEIVAVIARRDWLIHNFEANSPSSLLNPVNYLHNRKFENINYKAVFDLNVFQFLINCTKKSQPHESYRAAAAFLVFCQIADIRIEPCFAIYERLNYN